MNLSGKTILITRSAHQADEFIQAIKRQGGTPIVFPTIEITLPASWEACDRAIDSLYMYDGLIFTSTNGVEFFFQRLNERNASVQELKSKMICVVGEKTKQAVEQRKLSVTAMPEKFTALDLAKTIQQEDLHGKSFLFPRGNLANNTLPEHLKALGATVNAITVYETKAPRQRDINKVRQLLLEDKIDVATFTSPSTFKNFISLFPPIEVKALLRKTKIAVIGPVTAHAIKEAGLEADIVSKESTIESLVQSIEDFFQSKIQNQQSAIKQ